MAVKEKISSERTSTADGFGGIIFDIDNVLIDTRKSYLDAIRWTVEIFLTHGKVPLFTPVPKEEQPSLLSLEDIHQFKLLGGFNDDWDCCYGLLVYLLNLPVSSHSLKDLKKAMNLKKFVASVTEKPLHVNGITKLFKRPPSVKIETISRIFQEVYLGKDLFQRTQNLACKYWRKKGLIHKEKFIFRKSQLQKMKEQGLKLGIATGRPRFEAVFSLEAFGILSYFDAITTMDEVKKEEKKQQRSLRKPHPFSLLQTAEALKVKKGKLLYVGDLPDDVMAANKAKASAAMESAAFIQLAENVREIRREFEPYKPDYVLEKTGDLLKLLQ